MVKKRLFHSRFTLLTSVPSRHPVPLRVLVPSLLLHGAIGVIAFFILLSDKNVNTFPHTDYKYSIFRFSTSLFQLESGPVKLPHLTKIILDASLTPLNQELKKEITKQEKQTYLLRSQV